jgi:hypothetical protein
VQVSLPPSTRHVFYRFLQLGFQLLVLMATGASNGSANLEAAIDGHGACLRMLDR